MVTLIILLNDGQRFTFDFDLELARKEVFKIYKQGFFGTNNGKFIDYFPAHRIFQLTIEKKDEL